MPTRRHVLALLAASALPSCAESLPDPIAAWRSPGAGEADPRRYALAHAILAPNPHNRQPWLAELVGDNELRLFPDLERLLPATDPLDRQITIGCGAFLELLSLAAAERGFAAEVVVFPEGEGAPRLDERPFAHVRFVAGGARDPLFARIGARRTNREPFEARDVSTETLIGLAPSAEGLRFGFANGGAARDGLRALTWAAFDREAHTPAAHSETARLLRVGRREIATHRDGVAIEGPAIEVAQRLGLVSFEVLSNPDHWMTKPSIDSWRPLAEQAPAFGWIISTTNTRAAQIAAGRAYARLNLAATAQGLAIHPWSQALQEYPEMADHYAEARRLTETGAGETLQMLVRAGYGPSIAPAPRRGLGAHIRT